MAHIERLLLFSCSPFMLQWDRIIQSHSRAMKGFIVGFLGNWDLQAFVERFGLAGPVASLQFLTQTHKD